MNTLILWLESDDTWSPEGWALSHGGKPTEMGQVTIENPSGWFSVMRDDCLIEDYGDAERDVLSSLLMHPISFLLEWRGSELLQLFIKEIPSDSGAILDNDHGLIVLAQHVKALPIDSWARVAQIHHVL